MNTKRNYFWRIAVAIAITGMVGTGCMSSHEDILEPITDCVKSCVWRYRKDASGVVITDHLDKTVVDLVIPESIEGLPVVGIAPWALACRRSLETIVIPGTVRTIGEHAFYGCSLRKVELKEGLQRIDKLAFSACRPLKAVLIPRSVTIVGAEAFPSWCELKGEGDVVMRAERDRLVCKKLEDAAREEDTRWGRQYADRMRNAKVGK